MDMLSKLVERTISAIPISIGTSLALESIFNGSLPAYDSSRVIPNHIDVTKYTEIWINLSTLIRNIQGASTRDIFNQCTPEVIRDVLISEIDTINSVFAIEGKGVCRPMYYYCTYDKLYNKYSTNKNIVFRKDNTVFQQAYKNLHDKTLKLLFKMTDECFKFNDELLPKHSTNSLIITHVPYDLLSRHRFHKLDLLESHTGKLKTLHEWYTKYYQITDVDLSMMPFNKLLLLVFGDHVMITPSDIRLRRAVIDTAEQGKWTTVTTLSKIKLDFELYIKEPYVVQYLQSL